MYRIYECVATKHDPRVLVLALLLCFLASSTAIIIARRALDAPESKRWPWLLAAGAVTGLGIWATHFAAMLAFEPGATIRFDVQHTIAALACAVAFSVAGWTVGFRGDHRRPILGGMLIGAGLAGAHFLDTFGMQFAGTVDSRRGSGDGIDCIWPVVLRSGRLRGRPASTCRHSNPRKPSFGRRHRFLAYHRHVGGHVGGRPERPATCRRPWSERSRRMGDSCGCYYPCHRLRARRP